MEYFYLEDDKSNKVDFLHLSMLFPLLTMGYILRPKDTYNYLVFDTFTSYQKILIEFLICNRSECTCPVIYVRIVRICLFYCESCWNICIDNCFAISSSYAFNLHTFTEKVWKKPSNYKPFSLNKMCTSLQIWMYYFVCNWR